jgi:hypothetical protein
LQLFAIIYCRNWDSGYIIRTILQGCPVGDFCDMAIFTSQQKIGAAREREREKEREREGGAYRKF